MNNNNIDNNNKTTTPTVTAAGGGKAPSAAGTKIGSGTIVAAVDTSGGSTPAVAKVVDFAGDGDKGGKPSGNTVSDAKDDPPSVGKRSAAAGSGAKVGSVKKGEGGELDIGGKGCVAVASVTGSTSKDGKEVSGADDGDKGGNQSSNAGSGAKVGTNRDGERNGKGEDGKTGIGGKGCVAVGSVVESPSKEKKKGVSRADTGDKGEKRSGNAGSATKDGTSTDGKGHGGAESNGKDGSMGKGEGGKKDIKRGNGDVGTPPILGLQGAVRVATDAARAIRKETTKKPIATPAATDTSTPVLLAADTPGTLTDDSGIASPPASLTMESLFDQEKVQLHPAWLVLLSHQELTQYTPELETVDGSDEYKSGTTVEPKPGVIMETLRVNCNPPKAHLVTEILNNGLGNKAQVEIKVDPDLDGDKMHILLYDQVRIQCCYTWL